MSNLDIDGKLQISGTKHTIEYEPGAITGGATLFIRLTDGNKNVPIFYNEIDEVIQMLNKGKRTISALEDRYTKEPHEQGA